MQSRCINNSYIFTWWLTSIKSDFSKFCYTPWKCLNCCPQDIWWPSKPEGILGILDKETTDIEGFEITEFEIKACVVCLATLPPPLVEDSGAEFFFLQKNLEKNGGACNHEPNCWDSTDRVPSLSNQSLQSLSMLFRQPHH